jgi:hypothetical protein
VHFWLIPFYSQRTGKQASISILPAAISLNMGQRSLCRSFGGLVLFRITIPPLKYCLIAYFLLILPCARWPRSRLRSSGDIFLLRILIRQLKCSTKRFVQLILDTGAIDV